MKSSNIEIANEKILNYILKSPLNINIGEFCEINKVYRTGRMGNELYSRKRFLEVANKHGINITFIGCLKNSHGRNYYLRKKCKCEICKLAMAVHYRYKNQGKNIGNKLADYIANNYLKSYQEDNSIKHRSFYIEIDSKIESFKLKLENH